MRRRDLLVYCVREREKKRGRCKKKKDTGI